MLLLLGVDALIRSLAGGSGGTKMNGDVEGDTKIEGRRIG